MLRVTLHKKRLLFNHPIENFCAIVGHASKKKRADLCGNTRSTLDLNPFNQGVEIMVKDSSATALEETPHQTETTQITISDALRRRARVLINDRLIDPQWRDIIRDALEINDPSLPDLVRRVDAGERIIHTTDFSERRETNEDHSRREKIEALGDLICGGGEKPAAALFVLMGILKNSTEPEALAHAVKYFAFTRCGELNVFGMVDAQIAVLEGELLADNTLPS